MSDDEFNSLKEDEHAFIENAVVHEHQYGTPRSYIEYRVNHGINIILDIDVQGFQQIQNAGIENTSIWDGGFPSWHPFLDTVRNNGSHTICCC